MTKEEKIEIAQYVKQACIEAAKEGFQDASMSGLCREGIMEAAISAMEKLNPKQLLEASG